MTKILYIAGYGRSGSTTLSVVLGNHPRIASVGEVSFLFEDWTNQKGVCSCGTPYPECEFWKDLFVTGDPGREIPRLVRRIERASSLPRLWLGWIPSKERDDYLVWQERVFAHVAARTGATIIVDASKSARLSVGRCIALSKLARKEVFVLHLVRNGWATMESTVLTGSNRALEGRIPRLTFPALRAAVGWVWTNCFASMTRKLLGSDHYLLVRYEDFVSDPETVLRRIGDFVGVDTSQLVRQVESRQPFEVGHLAGGNRVRFEKTIQLRRDDGRIPGHRLKRAHRFLFACLGGWLNRRYGY